MKTNVHFLSWLAQFFLKWELCETKVVDKIRTHILCSATFLYRAVNEITWRKFVELGRPRMTVWRMRVACWIRKVKNTISECVIFIAFPSHHWLHERAKVLHYTYIACLVYIKLLTVYQPNTVLMCNVHCWYSYHYTYLHGNNVLYSRSFCDNRHYRLTICRCVMSTCSIGATCGGVSLLHEACR
jgi:hypothetical protein